MSWKQQRCPFWKAKKEERSWQLKISWCMTLVWWALNVLSKFIHNDSASPQPCHVYHFGCTAWQIMDKRKSISKKISLNEPRGDSNERWWMHSILTHTLAFWRMGTSHILRVYVAHNSTLCIWLSWQESEKNNIREKTLYLCLCCSRSGLNIHFNSAFTRVRENLKVKESCKAEQESMFYGILYVLMWTLWYMI